MFGDSSIAGLFTSPTVKDFMESQQQSMAQSMAQSGAQAAVPPPGTTFYDYVQQLIEDQPSYKYPDSMFGEAPAVKQLAPGFSAATPGSVESGGEGAQVGVPGYVSNGPMGAGFTQGEAARGALQGAMKGISGGLMGAAQGGLLGGLQGYAQAQDFVNQAIDAYGNVYGDLGKSWGADAPNAPANGGEESDPFSGSDYGWDSGGGGYDSPGAGPSASDVGFGGF